ncbi:hypothetical protein HYT84_04060 [Candidatus Micrarchaeota archaeon]|nr:hypothetical protein [Candidatus Micrarchaeota archaeon]
MVNLTLRTHPPVLFSYSPNHIEIIIRVENDSDNHYWTEADIIVPEKLSLSPDNTLKKGRVRIGIVEKKQYMEKSVKVYGNTYSNPQIYRCKVVGYYYNKDGVIDARVEKPIDIRCEIKKSNTM